MFQGSGFRDQCLGDFNFRIRFGSFDSKNLARKKMLRVKQAPCRCSHLGREKYDDRTG